MINVLHVTEDHSLAFGGITTLLNELILHTEGFCNSSILCVRENASVPNSSTRLVRVAPTLWGRRWGWSPLLKLQCEALVGGDAHSLLHLHGPWMAPQYVGAVVGVKHNRPFVFSAHGTLEPWLWKSRGMLHLWKKKSYWRHIAAPKLSRASVVHAITNLERDNLRPLFPKTQIEVIPHGIGDGHVPDGVATGDLNKEIVFLGRIDPKKGIDLLVEAFSRAKLTNDVILTIAGPIWSSSYYHKLSKMVRDSDKSTKIRFIGPIFGSEKWALLRRAWLVVVPSFSEAIGFVNLEAGLASTPTLTTPQTGLDGWSEGGGLVVSDILSLIDGIEEAMSWSLGERLDRGKKIREFVRTRYSWNVVAPLWEELYRSVLR